MTTAWQSEHRVYHFRMTASVENFFSQEIGAIILSQNLTIKQYGLSMYENA